MLTNEKQISDIENFKNKEMLLDVIRRQREQNFSRATNAGEDTGGTGPSEGGQGGQETPTVYGGDAGSVNIEGSNDDFADQLRRIGTSTTGVHSSTDQYERTTTKRSAWDSIKSTAKQYKDIYTKKEHHTDAPTRATKKVDGRKLTDAEALRLRPKLVEYVLWQSEHLDQFIIATTTGHDPSIEIWSDITIDEAQIIVDYLIQRGKTDVRTAHAVRYASTLIDRLKLGLIVGPRMYKTAMIYIQRGINIYG